MISRRAQHRRVQHQQDGSGPLGADHVIDYTAEHFADGRPHYDLILDIGGNSRLARLRRALTPTGTLVIAGGEGAWRSPGPVTHREQEHPVIRR